MAFLAVCEGYIVEARLLLDEFNTLRQKHGKEWAKHDTNGIANKLIPAHTAMQKQLGNMPSKWGAALEFDEENAPSH
jgi:hypothetical protein